MVTAAEGKCSISDGGNRSGIICNISDGVNGGEDIPLQMVDLPLQMVPPVEQIFILTDSLVGKGVEILNTLQYATATALNIMERGAPPPVEAVEI